MRLISRREVIPCARSSAFDGYGDRRLCGLREQALHFRHLRADICERRHRAGAKSERADIGIFAEGRRDNRETADALPVHRYNDVRRTICLEGRGIDDGPC